MAFLPHSCISLSSANFETFSKSTVVSIPAFVSALVSLYHLFQSVVGSITVFGKT